MERTRWITEEPLTFHNVSFFFFAPRISFKHVYTTHDARNHTLSVLEMVAVSVAPKSRTPGICCRGGSIPCRRKLIGQTLEAQVAKSDLQFITNHQEHNRKGTDVCVRVVSACEKNLYVWCGVWCDVMWFGSVSVSVSLLPLFSFFSRRFLLFLVRLLLLCVQSQSIMLLAASVCWVGCPCGFSWTKKDAIHICQGYQRASDLPRLFTNRNRWFTNKIAHRTFQDDFPHRIFQDYVPRRTFQDDLPTHQTFANKHKALHRITHRESLLSSCVNTPFFSNRKNNLMSKRDPFLWVFFS